MPTPNDIRNQLELLALHRQNIQHFRRQQLAHGGAAYAPPMTHTGLAEAVAGVAHCKAIVRAWGGVVDDLPDDNGAPGVLTVAQTTAHLCDLPIDPDYPVPDPQMLPDPHRMPLSANPLFVGRASELRSLAARLKGGESVVVTTGIGGVGKTQLAIELAHRYGCYFRGGVFWLSCADPAGITAEVVACGRAMGLFRNAEQLTQDEQVARVRAAWASELPRLLIFDNCEEEATLRAWKPTTGASRVLVTSRRATWSATLGVATQPLDVLPLAESIVLLRKHCPALAQADAVAIAEELGRLPLALHLAGHFLARYPAVTPSAYLAKLRSPALLEHPSLVGRGVQDMPTEREPNVARAFTLSFERLELKNQIDVLALVLLARAACLAPGEPFPQALLVATVSMKGDKEACELALTDALGRLLGLGLLEQEEGEQLRLHRLLAAYVAHAIDDTHAQTAVERAMIHTVAAVNKTGLVVPMVPVLAHVRYLVRHAQEQARSDEVAATLYSELGYYFETIGHYEAAMPLFEAALQIREQQLGSDHPDTATSLNNLASVYESEGQYTRAEPLYKRALQIREQQLGAHHPRTATSLNNLASLYEAQQCYAEAEPLLVRALQIREQVLGSEHPDTATSLCNLAGLYLKQERYAETKPLLVQALDIRERVMGWDHPDTAISLNNLAGLYLKRKAYTMAQPLFERSLAIQEQVFGNDHPATAQVLVNLAFVVQGQEQYQLAEALFWRALQIYERQLRPHHPLIGSTLHGLAELHRSQEQYLAALPLYERLLQLREQELEPLHPAIVESLDRLGEMHMAQGQFVAALPLYERALRIITEALGPDHPYVQDTGAKLNDLYGMVFPALKQPIGDAQLALILSRARIAVATVLADPTANRAVLEQAIECCACWAEEGEDEGSHYHVMATELRTLLPQLTAEPNNAVFAVAAKAEKTCRRGA